MRGRKDIGGNRPFAKPEHVHFLPAWKDVPDNRCRILGELAMRQRDNPALRTPISSRGEGYDRASFAHLLDQVSEFVDIAVLASVKQH
jgi:hypothetical protein